MYVGWVGLTGATDLNFEISNPNLFGAVLRPMGGNLFVSEIGARGGRVLEEGEGRMEDDGGSGRAVVLVVVAVAVLNVANDVDDGTIVDCCTGMDVIRG